jgi:hypothetical protein
MEVCDRCDGPHRSSRCPDFSKERENHPDALVRRHAEEGATTGASTPVHVVLGEVVRMPGDGSCMFHALNFGTPPEDGSNYTADILRVEIAYFIGKNAAFEVCGSPLSDWIEWDSRKSVSDYVKGIAWHGAWGGGIELAVYAHLFNCEVHVYDRYGVGYRRISRFAQGSPGPPVSVLYVGGSHYDALRILTRVGA